MVGAKFRACEWCARVFRREEEVVMNYVLSTALRGQVNEMMNGLSCLADVPEDVI